MSNLGLGFKPHNLTVELSKTGVFWSTLVTEDGSNYPVGTVFELVIGAITWTATILNDTASFVQDNTSVLAVISSGVTEAKLYVTTSGNRILWAIGTVEIYD